MADSFLFYRISILKEWTRKDLYGRVGNPWTMRCAQNFRIKRNTWIKWHIDIKFLFDTPLMLVISGGNSLSILWLKSRLIKRTRYPIPIGKVVNLLHDRFWINTVNRVCVVLQNALSPKQEYTSKHLPNSPAWSSLQWQGQFLSISCFPDPRNAARKA